jgi:hypothetical protein
LENPWDAFTCACLLYEIIDVGSARLPRLRHEIRFSEPQIQIQLFDLLLPRVWLRKDRSAEASETWPTKVMLQQMDMMFRAMKQIEALVGQNLSALNHRIQELLARLDQVPNKDTPE